MNAFFSKIHKPLGIAVIATGAIHGLLSFIKHPQAITENLSGILVLVLLILLALTYCARNKLKAKWFPMHRVFAVLLIAVLIIHIVVSILSKHLKTTPLV